MDAQEELTQEQESQIRLDAKKEFWGGEATESDVDEILDAQPDNRDDEPKVEDDPWAGVNPALRKQFDELSSAVEGYGSMPDRLKQAERRIGSLTTQLTEADEKAAVDTQETESAPTKDEIEAAGKADEDWEELREEFPEWANAIDTRLAAERANLGPGIKELQKKIEVLESGNSLSGDSEIAETVKSLREDMVEFRHPNWKGTINTPEYKDWFSAQPVDVQQKAASVQPKDAITVLDLFEDREGGGGEKTAAQIEAGRKARLSKSQLPSSNHRRTHPKSDEDMTDAEYYQKMSQPQNWDNL